MLGLSQLGVFLKFNLPTKPNDFFFFQKVLFIYMHLCILCKKNEIGILLGPFHFGTLYHPLTSPDLEMGPRDV